MPDLAAFATLTPRSEYWLGFLTADGCVSCGRETILVLQRRDEEHVRAFAEFLGCDDRPLAIVNGGNGVRLSIGCAALARQLMRYGVVAGRGDRPDLEVPAELTSSRHFWRGMVDGDGSLKLDGNTGIPSVQLVGRPSLVDAFADFLAHHLPFRPVPYAHAQSERVKLVGVGGRSAKTTVEVLYGGAPADALPRKRDRAHAILAWQPQVFSRYPWDRWADGSEWVLERGADYVIARRVWEAGRRFGRRHGLELHFSDEGDQVRLRFSPRARAQSASTLAPPGP